ncbi:unnamed protein product [Lepeophtheirus salmonis]|uniref:(salmon louse) hypothetical protein n=1 Tax=Lepeophtheirus salmonis TaxID=72036 RepID=A0A7R8HD16_LEPSM|nr:unnamed protein product [Lepeophtheirus salmonis]CAF3017657.1 unnamed protein product [Lepeophtheirus salmonis]
MKFRLFVFILVDLSLCTSAGLLSKIDYFGRLIYQTALNCGCPCREIEIVNCRVLYETTCKPGYYEECTRIPRVIEEREIQHECQDCFSEYQTITVPTQIKECYPVFDEKCTTSYIAQCSTSNECTRLYKTHCETSGYSQNCEKIPYERCSPITKCHRTPETKYKRKREFKKCSPYPDKKVPTSCNGFINDEKDIVITKTRQSIVAPSDNDLNYNRKIEESKAIRDEAPNLSSLSSIYALNPAPDRGSIFPLSKNEEAEEEDYNYALHRNDYSSELLPSPINTKPGSEFGPITDGFKPLDSKLLKKYYSVDPYDILS